MFERSSESADVTPSKAAGCTAGMGQLVPFRVAHTCCYTELLVALFATYNKFCLGTVK